MAISAAAVASTMRTVNHQKPTSTKGLLGGRWEKAFLGRHLFPFSHAGNASSAWHDPLEPARSSASGALVEPPPPPAPHSRLPHTNELKPCSRRCNRARALSHLQAPGVARDLKGYVKRCQSRRFTRCNRCRSSQPAHTMTKKNTHTKKSEEEEESKNRSNMRRRYRKV